MCVQHMGFLGGLAQREQLSAQAPLPRPHLEGTGRGRRSSGAEIRKGPQGSFCLFIFQSEVTGPGSQFQKPEVLTGRAVLLGAPAAWLMTAAQLLPRVETKTWERQSQKVRKRTSQHKGRRSGNGLLLGLYFLSSPLCCGLACDSTGLLTLAQVCVSVCVPVCMRVHTCVHACSGIRSMGNPLKLCLAVHLLTMNLLGTTPVFGSEEDTRDPKQISFVLLQRPDRAHAGVPRGDQSSRERT